MRLRCRSCGRFTRVSHRRAKGEPIWEEEREDFGGITAITPRYKGTSHYCGNCETTWQEDGFFGEGPIGIKLVIEKITEPVDVQTLTDMFADRLEEADDG